MLGFLGLLYEWREWLYEFLGAQISRQMLLAQRSLVLMLGFSAMLWVARAAPTGLWRDRRYARSLQMANTEPTERGALHQPKWVTVLRGRRGEASPAC